MGSMIKETEKGIKVTIYFPGAFLGNILKYEGKLLDYGLRPYAQYPEVPYVDFIPKGKRKQVRVTQSYDPYMVILAGFGNPDPDPMYGTEEKLPSGTVVRKSRYSSFDSKWREDFNELLDLFRDKIAYIADFREKVLA
jgi:hypothetical protein